MKNAVLEKVCIVCGREFPRTTLDCPDDLVRLTEKDPLLGTIFDGKFEILDFIGVGGLSRVYKARHKELNRIFALKILKSSDMVDLQRFRREAISVGHLNHPNIAQVFAFSVSPESRPYMVLEFIEGRDLADHLARSGTLSEGEAVHVFRQVAAALIHAHNNGVIHRDIKPGNIIMLSHPYDEIDIKVVDFGMARLLLQDPERAQRITLEGEILGTRQYISPEQYSGAKADARADIFALGVTMRESVISNGKVPELLKPIIDRCTEVNPEKRIQTAQELLQYFDQLQDAHPKLATRYSDGTYSGERFVFLQMSVAIIALMVVGAAAFVYVAKSGRSPSNELSAAPKKKFISSVSFAGTQTQVGDLMRKGAVASAARILENWLAKNESALHYSDTLSAYRMLINCYGSLGNKREARHSCESAIAFVKANKGSNWNLAEFFSMLAVQLHYSDRPAQAREMAESALKEVTKPSSEYERGVALQVMNALEMCAISENKLDEAESWTRRALALAEEVGVGTSTMAHAQERLCGVLLRKKDYKGALEAIEESIIIFKRSRPSNDLIYLRVISERAEVELAMKKFKEFEQDYNYLAKSILVNQEINQSAKNEILQRMISFARFLHREEDEKRWQAKL